MPRPGVRVLVIDADDERRRLCREVLTVAGFDVDLLEPSPGTRDDAGRATCAEDASSIAVTTVDGLATAARHGVHAHRCLVLTDDPAAHLDDPRAREWLATPLAPAALRRAVADLLDADDPVADDPVESPPTASPPGTSGTAGS